MKLYIYSVLMEGGTPPKSVGCIPGLCVAHSLNEAVGIALAYARENCPHYHVYGPSAVEVDPSKVLAMLKSLDAWEWISNVHKVVDGTLIVKK